MSILPKHSGSTLGRIVMALAFFSMLVGLSVGPALGEERYERGGRRDERRIERFRRERHRHRPVRVYVPPPPPIVYAPPPVVYVPPPPSPGISLIFPIRIR